MEALIMFAGIAGVGGFVWNGFMVIYAYRNKKAEQLFSRVEQAH